MRAQEFITEKINPDVVSPDFHAEKTVQTRAGTITLVARPLDDRSRSVPQFVVKAYDAQGREIGYVRFVVADYEPDAPHRWLDRMFKREKKDPYVVAGYARVNQDLQRQGIGTAIYDFVREIGNDIRPSRSQSDAARAMWRSFDRAKTSELTERRTPSIRAQIQDDVRKHGGRPDEYFVRFTDVDKLGFSDRQHFKRHPEIDDPDFTVTGLGNVSRQAGRRALWFYPLKEYLRQSAQDQYAMDFPYVWLVRIRPDAWLQPISPRDPRQVRVAPEGKRRVGILKGGLTPQAVFFEPAFDVVGKYYDYAGQHQRHGQVKGPPEPTFFDRVRGDQ